MRTPLAARWLALAALLATQLGVVASAAVHDEPVYAGDDVLAFKSEDAAARAAAEYGATPLDWAAVQASASFLPSRGDFR